MANQKGLIQLQGRIGNITFYKDGNTFKARASNGISSHRMKTDPVFQRARENATEFGRAATAGKLIRRALATLIAACSTDRYMVPRLHKTMYSALKADVTNARGERRVAAGNPLLVNSFDFNLNAKMSTTLRAAWKVTFNRVIGAGAITIPTFVPAYSLSAPQAATHYRFEAAAIEADFESSSCNTAFQQSAYLPVNGNAASPCTLVLNLAPDSTLPVFHVLALKFYQEVNGTMYSLADGHFDALQIVGVDV